jgi:hypothetical protein
VPQDTGKPQHPGGSTGPPPSTTLLQSFKSPTPTSNELSHAVDPMPELKLNKQQCPLLHLSLNQESVKNCISRLAQVKAYTLAKVLDSLQMDRVPIGLLLRRLLLEENRTCHPPKARQREMGPLLDKLRVTVHNCLSESSSCDKRDRDILASVAFSEDGDADLSKPNTTWTELFVANRKHWETSRRCIALLHGATVEMYK